LSKYRRAARIDEAQPGIVKELRRLGYSVQIGVDDIYVGHNGLNYWFEIKSPDKTLKNDGTYKAGAIKQSQIKLSESWAGHYDIVHSIEQIIEIINK
jgi:hypothetical protein